MVVQPNVLVERRLTDELVERLAAFIRERAGTFAELTLCDLPYDEEAYRITAEQLEIHAVKIAQYAVGEITCRAFDAAGDAGADI